MKFNVKPGDRAIIIRHVCQENIGKLVHVVRAYDNDEILPGTQRRFKRPYSVRLKDGLGPNVEN